MISKYKLGLVIGSAFGLWHFVWAILVASGFAQSLMDWIFKLHFIQPLYVVTPFKPLLALTLIVVTSVLGYLSGWIAAAIWNWLHTERISAAVRSERHAT